MAFGLENLFKRNAPKRPDKPGDASYEAAKAAETSRPFTAEEKKIPYVQSTENPDIWTRTLPDGSTYTVNMERVTGSVRDPNELERIEAEKNG